MEHLEASFDQLEEAYEALYSKTVEAANYADAQGQYHGQMFDVMGEEIFQPDLFNLEQLKEQALEEAQRLQNKVDAYLFSLSRDKQAYTDGKDFTPERAQEIEERMEEMREVYNELDTELDIIAGKKVPEEDAEGIQSTKYHG